MREHLSLFEAARRLGEDVGRVRLRAQRGELGAIRVRGEWLVDAEALAVLVAELQTAPGARDW